MKKIIFVILLLAIFSLNKRYNSPYDSGYEAGREGEKMPLVLLLSQEAREGYEQGAMDAWMYDEGFYDGCKGKRPKYLDDPDYMDGYNDGKQSE